MTSFGSWVDVAAPGEQILSTVPGGGFALKSGTSMASPLVAGLAGLVRASCPFSTPQQIVDRISVTADPIPGTGTLWKFGRVNAFKAVCMQAPGLSAGPVTATTITVRWNDTMPGESRFELAYGPSGQPATTTVTLPPNTTSYVHTNVPAGARFDYQVRVCDPNGCSAWSNKITVESNTRKLSVSRDGLGSVTGAGIACGNVSTPSDCSEIYSYGTSVTLTATNYTNTKLGIVYAFDHWEGACAGTAKTCTVSMTTNRSVTAVLESIGD